MNILGFDPSLTSSGYCYKDPRGELRTGRVRSKKLKGVERLSFIRGAMLSILREHYIDLIAYEGYAMGFGGKRNPGRVFDIGELGGVLRLVAYDAGLDMLMVAPTSLKMFATGHGDADKPAILAAVRDNWGYDTKYDDEADAYVLYKLGEAFTNARKRRGYSAKQQEALDKVTLVRGA